MGIETLPLQAGNWSSVSDWLTLISGGTFTSSLNITRATGTTVALSTKVTGDTVARYQFDANGRQQWGAGGVSALDTDLQRSAASVLTTSGTFVATKFSHDDFSIAFGDTGSFLQLRRHTTVPVAGGQTVADVYLQARGTKASGAFSYGLSVQAADDSSVATAAPAVTGCANNGAGLIRVTCVGHGFTTGDIVAVYGVVGTTEANGSWTITVISSSTFDLVGSTFASAYVSGGKATNRPGMYGGIVVVIPKQPRGGLTGTAQNADDLNGYGVFNGSANNSTATTGYLVNNNSGFTGDQWYQGFSVEANVTTAFMVQSAAVSQWGMDLRGQQASPPTFGAGALRIPNNVGVYARNAADGADVQLFHFSSGNELRLDATVRLISTMLVTDAANFDLGTTTGTKFGQSTTQKLAFYNSTPVTQPSTTGTATGFTAGGGTTVTDSSTFTGAVGSTAYRISDIVKHLKNLGLIAQ